MNPLTNVKNTQKLNETELELGLVGSKSSWHEDFKDSAWIFIGGLPYDLTEGDIVCVFSQYGEIVHINLVRDKQSGKSKGFCFLCYEDQRSTILAVDNLNSIKLLGRTLRVNHVADYKMPKEHEEDDEVTRKLREEGCAPRVPGDEVQKGEEEEEEMEYQSPSSKKSKKEKKKKKDKKKKKRSNEAETTSEHGTTPEVMDSRLNREAPGKVKEQRYRDVRDMVKEERHDPGYDKYTRRGHSDGSSDVDVSRSIRNKQNVKSEPNHGTKERGHDEYNPKTYRQQDRIKEMRDDVKLSRTIEYSVDERRASGSRTSRDSSCDDVKYEYKHGRDYDDDDDDRRENRTKSNHERRSNSSRDRHSDRYQESEPGRAGSDVTRKRSRAGEYSSRYDDHDSSRHRTTVHDHSTHSRRDHYEKDHMTNSPRRERHRSRSPRARYERMKITVEIEK